MHPISGFPSNGLIHSQIVELFSLETHLAFFPQLLQTWTLLWTGSDSRGVLPIVLVVVAAVVVTAMLSESFAI